MAFKSFFGKWLESPEKKTEGEVLLFIDEKDKSIMEMFPENMKYVCFENLQEKLLEHKNDIWRILKETNSRVYHAAAKDDQQVE